MSFQSPTIDGKASATERDMPVASDLNPGDANPPSRPGPITTVVFLAALATLLLYMNWKAVKGFLGMA